MQRQAHAQTNSSKRNLVLPYCKTIPLKRVPIPSNTELSAVSLPSLGPDSQGPLP